MTTLTTKRAICSARRESAVDESAGRGQKLHVSRWIGAFTAAIALVPFAPLLSRDGRVIPDSLYCDYESYQLPVREFARSEFLHGRFPLWIPYLGCGAPLHAGQQASLCHPLLTPLVLVLGANQGIKTCLFIQLALAFAGTYLLARELMISEWGASLAALVASWASFVVLHLMEGHVTIVLEYALLSWLFLALVRLLRNPGPRAAAALSCVLGMMLLAGQPQIAYYGLLFAAFWTAGSLAFGEGSRHRIGAIGWGTVALLCAVLLGAVQLLPALELSRDGMPFSERGVQGYAGRYALDALDIARFLAPNAAGNPLRGSKRFQADDFFHERILYVGILPLALAIFATTRRAAPRWTWGAASLLLLGMAIALGESTPAFDLLGACLPGLLLFRCPGRVGAAMTILIALLAGRGLDGWSRREPKTRGGTLWKPAAVAWMIVNLVASSAGHYSAPRGASEYLPYAREHVADELAVSAALITSSAAVLFLLPILVSNRRNWCCAVAMFVAMLDLGYESAANVSLAAPTTLGPPRVVANYKAARVVQAGHKQGFPEHSLNYSRIVPMLVASRISGVVTNEGGVLPSGLARLYRAIEKHPKSALAVAGCNWACSAKADSWWELPDALPRCRLVPASYRPLIEAPIDQLRPADVAKLRRAHTGRVDLINGETNSLRLLATAPQSCLLVVADTTYPGWRCQVDGRPAALKAAHGVFRAVELPAGKHDVEFRFSSTSFQIGVGCSLLGAAIAAFLAAFRTLRSLSRRAARSDPPRDACSAAPADMGSPGVKAARADIRSVAVICALGLLLLAPLACSSPLRGASSALRWGLPDIHSGDEPHYLLMLNSLLNDGDLDLSNNYRAVHSGSCDAGRRFAGELIDHQVNWYVGDELQSWPFVFDTDRSHWRRNGDGELIAPLRSDLNAGAPAHEYCWHAPGMPLALAAILFPLRGGPLVEPAALFCSAAAVVSASYLFLLLIRPLAARESHALFATALAFLGTPAWHYGRTFFTEPFLLACAVGSYWLHLRRGNSLAAGVVLAAGSLIKPPFAALAAPLLADRLLANDARKVCHLVIPMLVGVAAICMFNDQMYGAPWRGSMRWIWANPVISLAGLAASWEHGLLTLSPVVIVSLFVWPAFCRSHPRDAGVLGAACIVWLSVIACWEMWHGGHCYGPRLIVPVVPFIVAPLAIVPERRWWSKQPARRLAIALGGISVVFNAVAAFGCGYSFGFHPLTIIRAWWS